MKLYQCREDKQCCSKVFAAEKMPTPGDKILECPVLGDCLPKEITTVTGPDGQKYRVMLVPDLSEEAST